MTHILDSTKSDRAHILNNEKSTYIFLKIKSYRVSDFSIHSILPHLNVARTVLW